MRSAGSRVIRGVLLLSAVLWCGLMACRAGAQSATTLQLVTSASPALAGSNVTFTAMASTTIANSGVPNGPVVFLSDGTVQGTGTLDATGTATLTTAALTVGTHNITATYAGNANFGASSSGSVSQVIAVPTGSFVVNPSPQTQVIHGAGKTVYQLTVVSQGGFAGPVTLTCAGLPADASCSFAQPVLTLTANGSASTTLTTTTTATDYQASLKAPRALPGMADPAATGADARRQLGLLQLAAVFPVQLGGVGLVFAGGPRRRRAGVRVLGMLAGTVLLLGIAGCGCPVNASRGYPVTITATSTLGGSAQSSAVVYLYVVQAS